MKNSRNHFIKYNSMRATGQKVENKWLKEHTVLNVTSISILTTARLREHNQSSGGGKMQNPGNGKDCFEILSSEHGTAIALWTQSSCGYLNINCTISSQKIFQHRQEEAHQDPPLIKELVAIDNFCRRDRENTSSLWHDSWCSRGQPHTHIHRDGTN